MKQKKISANLPAELLQRACEVADMNQTEALVAGLQELIAAHQRKKIVSLKGKIHIEDVEKARERVRL